MKTLLALLLLTLAASAQTPGQWTFQKRKASGAGFDLFGVTPQNNKVFGINSSGQLEMVSASGSTTLAALTDVAINELVADQFLRYDATAGDWINTTPGAWTLAGLSGMTDTISGSQSGIGWADGRFTIQGPEGALQMFETGTPAESVLYWAGRIQTGSLEAGEITGDLDAALLTSGTISTSIINASMPPPFNAFVNSATGAGANGLTYGSTGPNASVEPSTPGTYFPEILVTDGGEDVNYLEGRIRTATQLRTDLGLGTLATISPTGTADSSTYLRGDGSWQTISAGATPGGVVQRVVVNETARNLSGTGLVAYSNSAAQAMSSGTEFLSITITPTSASNRLRLVCVINLGVSSTVHLSMICGRSGDTDARRQASVSSMGTRTDMIFTGTLTLDEVAGTTSAITYKIRAGAHNAATTYLNRAGAGDYPFGTSSSVTVEEYTP